MSSPGTIDGPAPPGSACACPAARRRTAGRVRALPRRDLWDEWADRPARELPRSTAGARVPFVLWATIWAHPRTPAHALSWLPTRHLYRHADAVATYGPHVSAYVAARRGRDDDVSSRRRPSPPAFRGGGHGRGPRAARRRAGAAGGQALFLFVGRLEREKGSTPARGVATCRPRRPRGAGGRG